MSKPIRQAALLIAMLAALPAAQAAVQSYSFSGEIETSSTNAYSAEAFSGNFSFDDANLPSVDVNGASWFTLSAFSMNFVGTHYALENGDAPAEVAFFNGNLLGVSYSASAFGPEITLVPTFPNVSDPAYLTTYTSTGSFGGSGTVIYAAVPEPESYAMLLAGLGLMGVLARRKALRG